ncbi:MAG TPA: TIR domain-containing protein [Thermoleophilaceae bacterium]|jgi:hypothetical protein
MTSKPGASAPKLFISYRREDTSGHAGRLYDAIVERFGDDQVFMDVELEPGIDFVDGITESVGSCDALLLIIGPRWATVSKDGTKPRLSDPADYVRLEVETALARSDLRLIPVLVAGARMPGADELPDSLQPLRRLNAIELSDARWRYDVRRLLSTVTGEEEEPAGAAASSSQPRGRVIAVAAGVAAVALVAVLAIAGVFSGGGGGSSGAGTGASAPQGAGPGAEALAHKYEAAFETKDETGLRKLLSPEIIYKRGASFERRGPEEVMSEYRRQFKEFDGRRPGFDWTLGGGDASEETGEVHGTYLISANGVSQQHGNFGLIALQVGQRIFIKELCFDCPDLHHPGGFLSAG